MKCKNCDHLLENPEVNYYYCDMWDKSIPADIEFMNCALFEPKGSKNIEVPEVTLDELEENSKENND